MNAVNGGTTVVPFASPVVMLTAGDYLECFAFQNSGGALNTTAGPDQTWLRLRLVAI